MKLLRDRNLNIAIFISASCHLICIFSIIPVLASGVIKKNPAVVSFLGSILEKVSVVSDEPNREKPQYGGLEGFDLSSPKIISNTLPAVPDKEKSVFLEQKHGIFPSGVYYGRKKNLQIEFKSVSIAGKARQRTILYRPPMPTLAVFNTYFSSDYSVSVKFKVSGHGFVEKPECIVSSGSSEVDNMAIRYIRRWQFIPSSKEENVAQEGVVRLNFDVS